MFMIWDPEIQRHYWTASFFLPVGIIFILVLVLLLMILFKRCPQMVVAIVMLIFGITLIFAALLSIYHEPIYA
ncbi:uncharacterized protein LOC143346800 [Colletes latitarsis]|uniref:uncharacterized protein LOC143346800 n=1 Tax=Colletes latitarsis TaxID=2605962 RepID=UPI0040364A11